MMHETMLSKINTAEAANDEAGAKTYKARKSLRAGPVSVGRTATSGSVDLDQSMLVGRRHFLRGI
jgi:hypothetical protein